MAMHDYYLKYRDLGRSVFSEEVYQSSLSQTKERYRGYIQDTTYIWWRNMHGCFEYPTHVEWWYRSQYSPRCIIFRGSSPGTLAGDIIRFIRDIPASSYDADVEINGDTLRILQPDEVPTPPDFDDDEEEEEVPDWSAEISQLPLIQADSNLHFIKNPRHPQEIRNLLVCKGHRGIVQLLGRSVDNALVFERLQTFISVAPFYLKSAWRIREALMQVIDALSFLHSKGIIHRDLHMNNLLFNAQNEIVLCDLEAQVAFSYCRAPELYLDNPEYTSKTDVYALGTMIWSMCFQNTPRTKFLAENCPPPEPFGTIYRACLLNDPLERPSLMQVKDMVAEIQFLECT